MEILKKIINKYVPLSLGSLIALAVMVNITSCEGCKKGKNLAGSPSISVEKDNLQGDDNKEGEWTLNPDPEKGVNLEEIELEIELEVNGGTGKASIEYEAYDDENEGKLITETIQGGKEKKKAALTHFYKLDGDRTILESTDSPLTKKITFRPEGNLTTKMVATFQLLNKAGESIGSACTITWTPEAAAATYKLETIDLEGGITIPATKTTFSVKVSKDKGKIEAAEVADFQINVNVKNDGDATINAGNPVSFAASDIKAGGFIEKEITVTPNTKSTEFELELTHKRISVAGATRKVVYHVVPVGTFNLAVDKDDIQDGATKITVTVAAGGVEVKKEDLAELSLKIERTVGINATIQDAIVTPEKADEFTYAFTAGANEFQIAADNKSATKELTIVPGNDKKAEFKVTILDKEKNAIASSAKTIKWENGVELQVVKIDYVVATSKFAYEIKNNSGAPEVDGIQLSWERKEGTTATVSGGEKGDVTIQIKDVSKIVAGELGVDWGTDATATFEFVVTHQGQQVYKDEQHIRQTAPKVKLALKNAAKVEFTGEGEKKVIFTVTAGEDLSESALKATKLDYTVAQGMLTFEGKDAKNITLKDLLKVTSLANTHVKDFELVIDNEKHSKAGFTDIKIKASENEDDAVNKVAQIEWKGEIKVQVQVQGKADLAQLKGDAGKTVQLTVTNTSGFNLIQADLEKVVIGLKNLTAGASVKYGPNNIEDGKTTLWSLLGGELEAGKTADKDLTIDTHTNPKVEFTLGLAGANKEATNHEVNVIWEGEIKVKIEGHDVTNVVDLTQLKGVIGKTIPVRISNQSGFNLTKADLDKVIIILKDPSDVAVAVTDAVDGALTTVGALLGGDLAAGDHLDVNLKLVTGTNQKASIKIELDGENKEVGKVVEVSWEEGIKVQVDGHDGKKVVDLSQLKGRSGKTVPVRFTNTSGFDLVEKELKEVKIQLPGLTAGASVKYGANNIEDGKTTLWDILGAKLASGTSQVKQLTIVPAKKQKSVGFELTLGGSNQEAAKTVKVVWNKKSVKQAQYPVIIEDAATPFALKGGSDNKFTLQFKNSAKKKNLDATALGTMKIVIDGAHQPTSITFNDGANDVAVESNKTTLADLLQSLDAGDTKDVEFTIDLGTNAALDFTIGITNSSAKDKEIKRAIKWQGEVKVKVQINTDQEDLNGAFSEAGMPFVLKVINKSGFKLSAEQLKQIIAKVEGTIDGGAGNGSDVFTIVYQAHGVTSVDPIAGKRLYDLLNNHTFQVKELNVDGEIDIPLNLWKGAAITATANKFKISLENAGTTEEKVIEWKE
ncbi:MAG: hypothetical protein BGO68_01025 [Candidatus Amoebophilus sp. 36-38]|nr:MAG: hypothetical protein BGO68_01025 [Candidatus Amoebophilus sp. 36-38]